MEAKHQPRVIGLGCMEAKYHPGIIDDGSINGEDETELMVLWIMGRNATYRERDSHSNVMSPV